jgi:hypothetical protein
MDVTALEAGRVGGVGAPASVDDATLALRLLEAHRAKRAVLHPEHALRNGAGGPPLRAYAAVNWQLQSMLAAAPSAIVV